VGKVVRGIYLGGGPRREQPWDEKLRKAAKPCRGKSKALPGFRLYRPRGGLEFWKQVQLEREEHFLTGYRNSSVGLSLRAGWESNHRKKERFGDRENSECSGKWPKQGKANKPEFESLGCICKVSDGLGSPRRVVRRGGG